VSWENLDDALEQLGRAAEEIAANHDGMMDAFGEERDARRRLLHAICEIVAQAIPAIAEGKRDVLVAAGSVCKLWVVELDARKGCVYFIGSDAAGQWSLCRTHSGDPRVLEVIPREGEVPRKLSIAEAVAKLGARLRGSLVGQSHARRLEARRMADKLTAISILLAKE
jgi:hypothetical protein